jgi:phage-related protein
MGMFELRTQGRVKVRVLYIFHYKKAYLIHGFVKKAWKISSRELRYARGIHAEIISIA